MALPEATENGVFSHTPSSLSYISKGDGFVYLHMHYLRLYQGKKKNSKRLKAGQWGKVGYIRTDS